jgi:hypothetical protein
MTPTELHIQIVQTRKEISDALNEANRLCTFAASKALDLEEMERKLIKISRLS